MARLSYADHFEGLITALDVNGWCVYTTESEFLALKSRYESENRIGRPFYSVRKVDGTICEAYIKQQEE